jgi:LCP family protein required for cell wall assembly
MNSTLDTFNELSTPPPNADGEQPPSLRVLQQLEAGLTAELGLEDVRDPGDNSVTLLLMGVDARPGESIDIGVRPDSLSVLHISGDGGTCRALSIPRDTAVNLPGYGQSKINHALSVGGVPYQELVVEQFIGVEIDHFALIDFAGMAEVIDAIGGVTVTNPAEFSYEGVSVPAGQPALTGEQALVFARFRGDAEDDFGRQRRQQELLQAVLQQTGGLDVARMTPTLLGSLDGHFKTDLKITSLISLLGDALANCGPGELQTASIDGTVGSAWDDLEGMELSFVQVPDAEVSSKVGWLLDDAVALTSPGITPGPAERRPGRT